LSVYFLSHLPSLPSSLHYLVFLWISIHQEAQAVKFNCSCTSGFIDCSCLLPISSKIVSCISELLRLQLSSTIFPSSIVICTSGPLRLQLSSTSFSSSIVTVLPDYSDYNCFLSFFRLICLNFFRLSKFFFCLLHTIVNDIKVLM
jgi:hypothetical protein